MKFAIKIRCIYSPLFSIDTIRSKWANKERFGYVVGETRDRKCWYVLWDNAKMPITLHKTHILLVNSGQEEGG